MANVNFQSPGQIEQQALAEAEAKNAAEERQRRPAVTGLAAYVRECWNAAKEAKVEIENRMLKNLRQKCGEYEPDKLRAIQGQTGSDIYMMLTDEKCSAATAWLTDILFPSDDKPWGTESTSIPELSPQQMQKINMMVKQKAMQRLAEQVKIEIYAGQIKDMAAANDRLKSLLQAEAKTVAENLKQEMTKQAKKAREKVEGKIADVVEEAGWEDAVQETIDDIVTFPAGIIKGPVLRKRNKIRWKKNQQSQVQPQQGQGYPQQEAPVEVREEILIEFNRVSPFDIYPFPNSQTANDGIIERHKLTRADLQALIGVDGYDEEAIRLVLQDYSASGDWLSVAHDQTRQALEDRHNEWRTPESNKKIDALQMWASVQGLMLLENGTPPERVPDPLSEYQVEVWLIDKYVIKCEINGDPLGRVPYHFASFRRRNGSIWGAGLPELMSDAQDACNAAARNLMNNMGISSGPQVIYDMSQMPAGENLSEMYPWKIWQVDASKSVSGNSGRRPVDFFVPPTMAKQLMEVYEFFSGEADSKTGVPKYTYGDNQSTSGALGTASGFSMMMNNVARGIKAVIRNIDKGIIKPSIQMTHEWELLYSQDPEYYVGDIKLVARGSRALIAKEQAAVRRNEFLQISLNPAILEIIGRDGLAIVLREITEGMEFKENPVPEKEEMLQRMQQQQIQQIQAMQQQEIDQGPKKGRQVDGAGAVQGGGDSKTM